MRRLAVAAALALAATATATGCDDGNDPDASASAETPSTRPSPGGPSIQVRGEDPRIATTDSGFTTTAALRGVLRYDTATRCLYLETQKGNVLPIFSTWTSPALKPVLRDGRRGLDTGNKGTVLEGDKAIIGGVPIPRRPDNAPDSCAPQATTITTSDGIEPDA